MKAIIMAGGSGKRLRPLTCLIPKPMTPVLGKPVMAHAVETLRALGIRSIGATLGYRAEQIQTYFGESLTYFVEDKPLGTAGSVKAAQAFLDETFLIVSGDALFDLDLAEAIRFHKEKNALATLVLARVDEPLEYGVVLQDKEGRISRFYEKPSRGEVFSDTVNTGIYILEPQVLERIPEGESFDFGKQVFPQMVEDGLPLFGYVAQGYWCDIGDVNAYRRAVTDALCGRAGAFVPKAAQSAVIENGASLRMPVWIGENVVVRTGAVVGPNVVLEEGVHIESGAALSQSVVWKGARVGRRAEVRGAVVCDGASLGAGAQMYEGTVLGANALLGDGASLLKGVSVWPDARVPAGLRLSGNVKAGEGVLRFGQRGVRAGLGRLPSAEVFGKLGGALAELAGGDGFALAFDGGAAAKAAMLALASGLGFAGERAYLCGAVGAQAMLCAAEEYACGGSGYVYAGGEGLSVELFDREGQELTVQAMRALEHAFERGERAALALGEIPAPVTVPNASALRLLRLTLLLGSASAGEKGARCVDAPTASRAELRAFIPDSGEILCSIDETGEKLILTDEKGRDVPETLWPQLCAYVSHLLLPGAPVLGTWQNSAALEEMAALYQVPVKRCMPTRRALMRLCEEQPLQRALHFDAVAALLLILSALSREKRSLWEVVDALPQGRIIKRNVPMRRSGQGRLLKKLAGELENEKPLLEHGLYLRRGGGFAYICPQEESEDCLILCEMASMEASQELAGEMEALVRKALAEE